MASALRLKTAALFSSGEFGGQVTTVLQQCLPGTRMKHSTDVEQSFDERPDVVVAALWRADHVIGERADLRAHETGVPWLPVVLDHSVLRIGPFVSPGSGPCFRCFDQRLVQHDHQWESTRVLRSAYERDATVGPDGFLPSHARLAAGTAAGLLRRTAAGADTAGQVVTIPLSGLAVSLDRVVGVHACGRCRPSPPVRDLMSLLRLGEAEEVRG
ncbi:hypothetical protein GCM10010297_03490 [Streptomyces malachitofuscus]|nr:hypothetical protein GCM10010297_03490 [Streptomyces malachitofuscus]